MVFPSCVLYDIQNVVPLTNQYQKNMLFFNNCISLHNSALVTGEIRAVPRITVVPFNSFSISSHANPYDTFSGTKLVQFTNQGVTLLTTKTISGVVLLRWSRSVELSNHKPGE